MSQYARCSVPVDKVSENGNYGENFLPATNGSTAIHTHAHPFVVVVVAVAIFSRTFLVQVDIFVSGKFKLETSRALNFFPLLLAAFKRFNY